MKCPYGFWGVVVRHTLTVEEKPARAARLATSLTEGVHQLLELCGALDLEENFRLVIGNFDVEMLRGLWGVIVARWRWRSALRHCREVASGVS